MADIVGAGLGVAPERVAALLDLYESELHHDTYDPSFIARKRAEIQARTAEMRRKTDEARRKVQETAAAVAAMTVSDDDLKPPGA